MIGESPSAMIEASNTSPRTEVLNKFATDNSAKLERHVKYSTARARLNTMKCNATIHAGR